MRRQIIWLVCPSCGVKEWLHEGTPVVFCPNCNIPRHAEDNAGNPVMLWRTPGAPDIWLRLPT